jgi:crotonobetainyl-CoA:carnitine CoA-transferase CaiB-like acyl-CoA transferase
MSEDAGSRHDGALSDLRVLDLSGPIGVYCGKLLADLGADVVKVEPPGGDRMRSLGPFFPEVDGVSDGERSLYWWHYNTSKRGITLDLDRAEGRDLFRSLAGEADIVLESFTPGYLDERGCGWQALHAHNPRLILTSVTPFGQTGPYARFKGADIIGQAMGGVMNQVGFADRPPYVIGVEMAYFTVSTLAANGTMFAVFSRDNGGEGQHVDVSMQQAVALGTGSATTYYDILGRIVHRSRFGLSGDVPFRNTYPCKDGWVFVFIAVVGTTMEALRDLVNEKAPDLDFDPDWCDLQKLRGNRPEMAKFQDLLYRFFARYTGRELLEMAFDREPPVFAMPIEHADGMLRSPHLQERGFFVEVEHPELQQTITYPGAPYVLPESPWHLSRRAPLIGEHNAEVYRDWLHLDAAAIDRLRSAKVI